MIYKGLSILLSASFSPTSYGISFWIASKIVRSFSFRLHVCVVVFIHKCENWQRFSRLLLTNSW